MVRQNVSDLKLAVIELDGCLFPLNHYRYNFYKNLCKKQNVSLDRQTFYEALGNMYSMYDALPLAHSMDSASLNDKVEKDLYNYLKMKDQSANDGALEFLEYLRQKEIKIAVVTTHKTKNAIAYLEMGKLYNKVDYVIGNDTKLQPFPATDIFDFLMKKYQVTPEQTLLVTSLVSLLETGKEAHMNMIYMEDLVPAGEKERSLSYQTCKSLYEALNDVIFGRYEDYKMYESILGLDEDMSPEELRNVRIHLEDLYKDDDSLLDIVNKTYEFRLSELNVDPASLEDEKPVIPDTVPEVAEVEESEEAEDLSLSEMPNAFSEETESASESVAAPASEATSESEEIIEESSETAEPETTEEAAPPESAYEEIEPEPAETIASPRHSIEDILENLESSLSSREESLEEVDESEIPEVGEEPEEDVATSEVSEEETDEEDVYEDTPEEEPYEAYPESEAETAESMSEEEAYTSESENIEPEEESQVQDFGDTIIYNGPIDKESYEDTGILSLDPQKTIELDDVLSKVMARNEENFADETPATDFLIQDESRQEDTKLRKTANVIINILYTFALSLVILIIGLVIYIALQSQFDRGVLQFIANMYSAYSGFATILIRGIVNGLHTILPFLPSYAAYVSLSEGASSLINVYILNTVIIAIVELLVYFLRPKDDEDYYY